MREFYTLRHITLCGRSVTGSYPNILPNTYCTAPKGHIRTSGQILHNAKGSYPNILPNTAQCLGVLSEHLAKYCTMPRVHIRTSCQILHNAKGSYSNILPNTAQCTTPRRHLRTSCQILHSVTGSNPFEIRTSNQKLDYTKSIKYPMVDGFRENK